MTVAPMEHEVLLPAKWNYILAIVDFAFQPIVNINTGAVFGYEALLRNYQQAGFESIYDVFDAALIENVLVDFDLHLRLKAIEKFQTIPGSQNTKLFFNMDNRIWDDDEFNIQKALPSLKTNGFTSESLCLELSEKHNLLSDSKLFNDLACIKNRGFKIAIDDCGAGFSGLQLMYYTDPDYVKIDRFFISDIANNPKKRLFVLNIVNISHVIGSYVIAEGVETEKEFFICREIGCDLVQGFFIDKPRQNVFELQRTYNHVHRLADSDRRWTNNTDRKYILSQMVDIDPISIESNVIDVFEKFKNVGPHTTYPVVNHLYEPLGVISEHSFKPYAYSRIGAELLRNKNLADGLHRFISKCPVTDINTPVETILSLFSQDSSVEGIIIVDHLKYVGFLDAKSLLKALNDKNVAYARDQNPLSRLPGNRLINEYLSNALQHVMWPFVFAYFDMDNFKPFNDKYGFRNGDRVILLFAEILKKRSHVSNYFIGHIGGDDFFLGMKQCSMQEGRMEVQKILTKFRQDVRSFYDREDLLNEYIISTDREENVKKFPLLTASAVIIEAPGSRTRVHPLSEIGELIARNKKNAKKSPEKIATVQLD
ncbi:MAG: EAL domain-containing protein [bacterium]|nr:EAL domain-containing protein [bacterium]